MSVVDKMLIKGIRSFSPENTNVVTFYRPLTLIVGPNGAGKTTIIECLKHACTGEMPPNARSGHSFIHDPKVAGETETKGQIKLRFKTGAGKDVVCIRSFQLTQKGSKMEFKAIESVLQTINPHTGEKVCLSYRCADMDREVPTLMGVSKAILENVIFVHQDDANWPLAEGAVLKKRFDDIFSATRYTKALEVIKKLHKDQAHEIKLYKLKLENLQTLKDAAYKLRDGIEQDQQKATQLRSQITDFETKIKNSERNKVSIESALEQLKSLQSQIGIKEAKREMLLKLKSKQYQDLEEENEDTDEELASWLSDFQTEIGSLTLKISKLERDLNDSESKIQFLVQTFVSECQVQGKLEAELEIYLRQKQERDRCLENLYAKHNLGDIGYLPMRDEVAIGLLEKAALRLDELTKDHEQRKEASQKDVALLWRSVEKATEKYSRSEGKINAKLEQKSSKLEEVQRLDNLIKSFSFSTSKSDLRRLDENEKCSKEEVERCSSVMLMGDFDGKISTAKSSLCNLEEKLKVLQREKDGLASESSDRIYLRGRKEELVNKENNLSQIVEENKVNLAKVCKGRTPTPEVLKDEIDAAVSSSKELVSKLNAEILEAGKETVKVSSLLEESRINLAKYQRDRDVKRKILISKLNNILHLPAEADAFPEQLRIVRSVKDQKQKQHDTADGMRIMFDPFEKHARSKHACPCCDRPFSLHEEDDFVNKQRTKSSTIGTRLLDLKRERDDAENQFQNLEKLRAIYDDYQKLTKDLIPAAEKTLEELTNEQERVVIPYDDLSGLLAQANSDFELADNLRETADLADRLYHEIVHLKKQVREEEIKLDARSQTFRTLQHVNNDLIRTEEERDSVVKVLDHLREEQSHAKDEFAKWNLKYHNAREEKLKAIHSVDTLNKLKGDRGKLEEQLADIGVDIEMLQDSLGPLSSQKDSSVKEHEVLRTKLEAEEAENALELRKFKQEISDISAIATQIAAFVIAGKETKFREMKDRLSSLKAQQENEERQKAEISGELKSKTELKNNQSAVMRNIDDNINYRTTTKEIFELDKEIVNLEEQMVAFGESAILQADLQKLARHIQDLLSQKNRSQGTVAVYQTNVARNKADLKHAQYKDIDNRYCGQLIQLKTTEMANKDLDKYYSALDKALMRFHSMKMEEINKIVKELWQQTYRGQDIDYIEIRSDAEGAGTRSYSYRVIMRSGDAELEMRGRCSAGQKVLASLIIRLALAETFCLNCGILALDEPTTNLDGPNAESLASALVRIMEERRSQENFQLIVITHDERFAHLIGQREHAERYYRISKDDNQHSIIEAQDIFD